MVKLNPSWQISFDKNDCLIVCAVACPAWWCSRTSKHYSERLPDATNWSIIRRLLQKFSMSLTSWRTHPKCLNFCVCLCAELQLHMSEEVRASFLSLCVCATHKFQFEFYTNSVVFAFWFPGIAPNTSYLKSFQFFYSTDSWDSVSFILMSHHPLQPSLVSWHFQSGSKKQNSCLNLLWGTGPWFKLFNLDHCVVINMHWKVLCPCWSHGSPSLLCVYVKYIVVRIVSRS